MKNVITIAGATGNLGGRVVSALCSRGAPVRAIVRPGTAPERLVEAAATRKSRSLK